VEEKYTQKKNLSHTAAYAHSTNSGLRRAKEDAEATEVFMCLEYKPILRGLCDSSDRQGAGVRQALLASVASGIMLYDFGRGTVVAFPNLCLAIE
jgi:hypothetical protein